MCPNTEGPCPQLVFDQSIKSQLDNWLGRQKERGRTFRFALAKGNQPCKNSDKWSLATYLIWIGVAGKSGLPGEPKESALLEGEGSGVPNF